MKNYYPRNYCIGQPKKGLAQEIEKEIKEGNRLIARLSEKLYKENKGWEHLFLKLSPELIYFSEPTRFYTGKIGELENYVQERCERLEQIREQERIIEGRGWGSRKIGQKLKQTMSRAK